MEKEIKEGMTIWLESLHTRQGEKKELIKTTVGKVGKKYFETKDHWYGRFHLDTLMHDGKEYSSVYKVYTDEQDYHDKEERIKIIDDVRETFSHFTSVGLSLEKLRQISEIIKK